MHTYIALFRGINVGGKNILPMKELAELLEDMGYEKVSTYIQSGNVVFQSKNEQTSAAAEQIGSKILEAYRFEPKIFLLTASELKEAIKNNPFKTDVGNALHFLFLESHPQNPDLDGLIAVKSKSEEFKLNKNVFYLYAPDGVGRSKLVTKVERCLGVPATGRNWNTVRKLMSMAAE